MAAPTRTHYDVLGIAHDADASAVRAAWKLHVQAWHPDRFTGAMREEAERQACLINEAYTVLRDAGRRAAYDCRLAADEQDAQRAARPAPGRRASTTIPTRPASAPVGSPMAVAEQPRTFGEQLAASANEAIAIVRRHPRVFAAAATVWVVVFGGSLVMHVVSGPSLPSVSAKAVHAAPAVVADGEQAQDLEELAEIARREAAEADAELAEQMRQDEARARAEAAAVARQQAALAAQAAKAPRGGTASTTPRTATPGRVVRVMPNTVR